MNGAKIEIHDYTRDFTMIANQGLRDENLSFKARGLLAYIYSYANLKDWNFSIKGILAKSKQKETSIYSAINELKKYGYCWVEHLRSEGGGRISGIVYHFDAIPHPDWVGKY